MAAYTPCRLGTPTCLALILLSVCSALCKADIFSTFTAQKVQCTLYLGHEEKWVCGDVDTVEGGDDRFLTISYAAIHGATNSATLDLQRYIHDSGATPGKSKLTLSEVEASPKTAELNIPDGATIEIEDMVGNERRLARKPGVLRSLVVRVTDTRGNEPNITKRGLWDVAFKDPTGEKRSTAEHYRTCSYGQMKIRPYEKTLNDAIIDVEVSTPIEFNVTDRQVFANMALAEVKKMGYYDEVDLVSICVPFGTIANQVSWTRWYAYAIVGGKLSVANGDYCHSVSTWMHEIGHNVGLLHSGTTEGPNVDMTDLMGSSYDERDGGFKKQCFNPAKSYQLGWYSNMQTTVDPLTEFSAPSYSNTYEFVGVAGYDKKGDESNGLVVLKMDKYYVGYNIKKGPNSGVRAHGDKVLVVEQEEGKDSILHAEIGFGGRHTIIDFKEGRDVTIKVVGMSDDGVATVKIFDTQNAPEIDDDEDDLLTLPCNPDTHYEFKMEILGDMYPEDIKWFLSYNSTGEVILTQEGYTSKCNSNEPDVRTFCLPYAKDYRFTITDDHNDGIAYKGYGNGYYKGIGLDGQTLFEGPAYPGYEYSDSRTFSTPQLPGDEPPPVSPPTSPPTVQGCQDDPDWAWKGRPDRKCANIATFGPKAKANWCAFEVKDTGKLVEEFCPETCDLERCKSCENKEGKFRVDGARNYCHSITQEHCSMNSDRGKQIGTGPPVKELCPQVCDTERCPAARMLFENSNHATVRGGSSGR